MEQTNTHKKRSMVRRLAKKVFYFCLECGDALIGVLSFRNFNKEDDQGKKRILIIRLDGIGDFVLWLDAAKSLRALYPENQYSITIICNDFKEDLAREIPYWDEVWPVRFSDFKHKLFYRWNILHRVRKNNFDKVINPRFSKRYYFEDAIVRVSGANEKIGFEGDLSNITEKEKTRSDKWYTKLIPISHPDLMELQINAEFMRALGLSKFRAGVPQFPLISESANQSPDQAPYYVICPGARWDQKQWPIKKFGEIANYIFRKTGCIGWIIGSKEEQSIGEELENISNASLKNKVGQTSLLEAINIIKDAQFLIGNDTSTIHIAASVNTPSIAITGGGHFKRFLPYQIDENRPGQSLPEAVFHHMDCFNCNWQCIYPVDQGKAVPCIDKIAVEDVQERLEKIIGHAQKVAVK